MGNVAEVQEGALVKIKFSLKNENEFEQIESDMPFKTMTLFTFEQRIMKYYYGNKIIRLSQL